MTDWLRELSMEIEGTTYPFVEDENCNLTGLGYQDKEEFASWVNAYDEEMSGVILPADEQWTADDIAYQLVTPEYDKHGDWRLHAHDGDVPGAISVTVLWGAR